MNKAEQEGDDLAPMSLTVSEWVTEYRWDVLDANGSLVAVFHIEADAIWYVTARKAAEAMRMGCWLAREGGRLVVRGLYHDETISNPDGLTALALAYDVLMAREGQA